MEPITEPEKEPAIKIELSGVFNNNCEWCGEPMTTIHGVMIYDMCFNICPRCNAMFREKIDNKRKKAEAQDEMIKTLYRIGHPKSSESGYDKLIRLLHLSRRDI